MLYRLYGLLLIDYLLSIIVDNQILIADYWVLKSWWEADRSNGHRSVASALIFSFTILIISILLRKIDMIVSMDVHGGPWNGCEKKQYACLVKSIGTRYTYKLFIRYCLVTLFQRRSSKVQFNFFSMFILFVKTLIVQEFWLINCVRLKVEHSKRLYIKKNRGREASPCVPCVSCCYLSLVNVFTEEVL